MEIEGEDGTKLLLKAGVKAELGRGTGFNTEDLTVSRRHVLLEYRSAAGTESPDRVFIEVLGRNPVWVRDGKTDQTIRTIRKSETGEMLAGDRFCLSGHRPVWFNLKRCDEATNDSVSEGESGLDNVDISDMDPVKEFGFLVAGKEFDQYPKNQIRDIKQWEWFLEESAKGNSDEDEDEDKKGLSRKRRRKKGNKDDIWSGESEEDKEMMVKTKRVTGPSSSTRSKKPNASSNSSSSSAQTKQHGRVAVEEDEEEEDDEKLGGFIVSDEETNLEEEDEEEEEESNVDDDEEDFDEDEDEE